MRFSRILPRVLTPFAFASTAINVAISLMKKPSSCPAIKMGKTCQRPSLASTVPKRTLQKRGMNASGRLQRGGNRNADRDAELSGTTTLDNAAAGTSQHSAASASGPSRAAVGARPQLANLGRLPTCGSSPQATGCCFWMESRTPGSKVAPGSGAQAGTSRAGSGAPRPKRTRNPREAAFQPPHGESQPRR